MIRYASKFTAKQIRASLKRLAVCDICRLAKWKGEICRYCRIDERIEVISYVIFNEKVRIRIFTKTDMRREKKKKEKALTKKLCEVCNENYLRVNQEFCSSICYIRSMAAYYDGSGLLKVQMTLEEALVKLEKRKQYENSRRKN